MAMYVQWREATNCRIMAGRLYGRIHAWWECGDIHLGLTCTCAAIDPKGPCHITNTIANIGELLHSLQQATWFLNTVFVSMRVGFALRPAENVCCMSMFIVLSEREGPDFVVAVRSQQVRYFTFHLRNTRHLFSEGNSVVHVCQCLSY